MQKASTICALIPVLLLAGCDGNKPDNAQAAAGDRRTFEVRGLLKEIQTNGRTAVIQHEEIPDYMAAMTMPLDVRNTNELAGLQPGDAIAFRMVVTEDDGWIENVRKLHTNTLQIDQGPASFRVAPEVEPLEIGDELPEYKFTNQVGKVVSTSDFRGQALAVTFIFTRCPFPTFCPRMSSHLLAAQRRLKADPNAPTNWHFLSITIDPEFDTPAVLKQYAEIFNYDPARWDFVTADLWTIDGITEQFGLVFFRDQPGALPNHNLRTVVVDAKGRIHKIIPGNEWQVDELVEAISEAARL